MEGRRWLLSTSLAWAILACPSATRADLLIPTSTPGSQDIFDGFDYDDGITWYSEVELSAATRERSLGFTGELFGQSASSVFIRSDGFFTLAETTPPFFPTPLPSVTREPSQAGIARVAPLWEDFYYFSLLGSRIVETVDANYYSVTWDSLVPFFQFPFGGNDFSLLSFQATWFAAATTLNGLEFQAQDIVFSYHNWRVNGTIFVGVEDGNFGTLATVVGIEDGLGNHATFANDTFNSYTDNGVTTTNDAFYQDGYFELTSGSGPLPWDGETYLRFRPVRAITGDASSPIVSYDVAIIPQTAAIPEPSLVGFLGVLPAYWWLRRRQGTR